MDNQLLPKLLVSDADAAITYYHRALGAELLLRVADDRGAVNHAELSLDSGTFTLSQSAEEWGWSDPGSLGGSPVLLVLSVRDPDVTAERMVLHGGEIVIPVEDRPYGKRQGRVKDPFGHLWVISADSRPVR